MTTEKNKQLIQHRAELMNRHDLDAALAVFHPNYQKVQTYQVEMCQTCFRENIEKGIAQGLYRAEINIDAYVNFYYSVVGAIPTPPPWG